jgi:hypothetical protein
MFTIFAEIFYLIIFSYNINFFLINVLTKFWALLPEENRELNQDKRIDRRRYSFQARLWR